MHYHTQTKSEIKSKDIKLKLDNLTNKKINF